MNETGRWKRLLLEGATIVASILVAFGLDAAWDRSQDRSIARDQLEGAAEELRVVQRDYVQLAAYMEWLADAVQAELGRGR